MRSSWVCLGIGGYCVGGGALGREYAERNFACVERLKASRAGSRYSVGRRRLRALRRRRSCPRLAKLARLRVAERCGLKLGAAGLNRFPQNERATSVLGPMTFSGAKAIDIVAGHRDYTLCLNCEPVRRRLRTAIAGSFANLREGDAYRTIAYHRGRSFPHLLRPRNAWRRRRSIRRADVIDGAATRIIPPRREADGLSRVRVTA